VRDRPLLDKIKTPADIRSISPDELPELTREIRAELLHVVLNTGGHLASNLGAVELTVALLRVFDPSSDKMIWDTSHQGYTYKLLTGRRKLFQNLRQDNGCNGFLNREESKYDYFGAGHAGTAISAAAGMAVARDQQEGDENIIAIVGDGALGTGVALEGLNNIIETTENFIVVLNDNKMSIAPNVGAIAQHLNRIISGEFYNRLKTKAGDTVERIPFIGNNLKRRVKQVEEAAKGMLVPGLLFEELGLRYIGPLNGHDVDELCDTFENVKRLNQPLLVHVLTEKGHGYPAAEKAPESYHGVSKSSVCNNKFVEPQQTDKSEGKGEKKLRFSEASGRTIEKLMQRNERIVAITAGMCKGTGLTNIRDRFPGRYYDVGIAEEHAVVSAAGMAAAGERPVVAIYATFIQRAMDYVFHDVCLQNLPVIFCLDRAGIVPDGPTHHGIHDLAFWQTVPNLSVLQPTDGLELDSMMRMAFERKVPVIIRYPKGDATEIEENRAIQFEWGKSAVLKQGSDIAFWCSGREVLTGLNTAKQLNQNGIDAAVINARSLRPFDDELLKQYARKMPIATIENHVAYGGLGSIVKEALTNSEKKDIFTYAWPADKVVPFGTEQGIRTKFGLTPEQIAKDIKNGLER